MAAGGGHAAPSQAAADLPIMHVVTWDGLWAPCPKVLLWVGSPARPFERYTSVQRVAGDGVWWQPVSPGEDNSGDAALRVQGMACSSKEALGCVTWGCS